jgi:hypothetical protein
LGVGSAICRCVAERRARHKRAIHARRAIGPKPAAPGGEFVRSDGGFRVEHAIRVLFPATRRKHGVARDGHAGSSNLCAFGNFHPTRVCGQWPQTAPESGAPPGRQLRRSARRLSATGEIALVVYAARPFP